MSDRVSDSAGNDMATELFELCMTLGDDNLEVAVIQAFLWRTFFST